MHLNEMVVYPYRIIALVGFLVLVAVQFFLIYNTYELKDRQYFRSEQSLLDKEYGKTIPNDQVFPGAAKIIDSFVYRNMPILEKFYYQDKRIFNQYRIQVRDSIFQHLQAANNMDSVFRSIVLNNKLDSNLQYSLTIEDIGFNLNDYGYVPIYNYQEKALTGDTATYTPLGVHIGGHLKHPKKENQITWLNVGSPFKGTYKNTFSLYVDKNDRYLTILKLMLPIFALSLFSLLAVVVIYYFTYRNWMLQKKLADLKTDFVSSITHEFHTPISTIMVANKSLQKVKVLEDPMEVQSLTDVIDRQSKRLEMLFGQVLDITRMEKATLEKEEVKIGKFLKTIVTDYQFKLKEQDTQFQLVNLDKLVFSVSLNPFWFTTMVVNMFDNAIKYNDKERKVIIVQLEEYKGELLVKIADNGVGMEEDTVQHIFDKFYRANKKRMTHIPGLGLGLYYVQQCVHIHGWKMQVKSREHIGSEFTIIIP